MAHDLSPLAFGVEIPGEVTEEHHGEFQTLGLVDTHNSHRTGGALASHLQALFLLKFQILQELLQIPVAAVFVTGRQLVECLEVCLSCFAVGPGTVDAVHPGQLEDLLDQVGDGVHPGLPAKGGQGLQEFDGTWILVQQHGFIDGTMLLLAPESRQLIGGEAEDGASQSRQQGDILPGVGNGLQDGPQDLNFLAGQQIRAAAGGAADALIFQRTLEIGAHGAGGTEQNDDIIGLNGPQALLIPDQLPGIQHLPDPAGHIVGFFRIGILPHVDAVKLHRRVGQNIPGQALVQGFVRAVFQSAHPLAHAGAEHMIDRLDDLRAGAEIGRQQDLPALPCRRLRHGGIAVIFFQKDTGVRQSELVDGLLDIADHEAVAPVAGEGPEDGVLNLVGVLVLVHHDLLEAAAQFGGGRRGDPLALNIPSPQQIQHQMFKVRKVHAAAASLGLVEGFAEPAHQIDEAPAGGAGLAQIRQDLTRIVSKPHQPLFDALLAGFPAGLDALLGHGVEGFGKGQAAIVHRPVICQLVPVLAVPEAPQVHQGNFQILDRFAAGILGVGHFHIALHGLDAQVEIGEKFIHQIAAPDGLGGVVHFLHLAVGQAFAQPLLRVGMAHGAVIDFQHDIRNHPVITAQALGVHEGPEVGIFMGFGVGLVQQVFEHLLPDLSALVFIRHPKIAAEIHLLGVFPDHIGAEAVDRGDLRQEQTLHLALEVTVARVLRNGLRQPGGDLAPKLCCGGLGVCNDEEIIQMGTRILQILHQPLHQDLGLAGARRSGHQQISAPVGAGNILLLSQRHVHSSSRSLPRSPRHPLPPGSGVPPPQSRGTRRQRGRRCTRCGWRHGCRGWGPPGRRRSR